MSPEDDGAEMEEDDEDVAELRRAQILANDEGIFKIDRSVEA